LIYKHTQGKLEGESSSSSEVTLGFIPGTPSILTSEKTSKWQKEGNEMPMNGKTAATK